MTNSPSEHRQVTSSHPGDEIYLAIAAPPTTAGDRRRTTCLRIGALLIAVVPLGLLVVARGLEPSSEGLGTHQQLGLPPCSMRVLIGIRCPSCGMTTSWAHFARGHWIRSIQVNAGGFLLACLGLLVAWLALRTFWSAKTPGYHTQLVVTLISVAVVAVSIVDWGVRLMM